MADLGRLKKIVIESQLVEFEKVKTLFVTSDEESFDTVLIPVGDFEWMCETIAEK